MDLIITVVEMGGIKVRRYTLNTHATSSTQLSIFFNNAFDFDVSLTRADYRQLRAGVIQHYQSENYFDNRKLRYFIRVGQPEAMLLANISQGTVFPAPGQEVRE